MGPRIFKAILAGLSLIGLLFIAGGCLAGLYLLADYLHNKFPSIDGPIFLFGEFIVCVGIVNSVMYYIEHED